MPVTPIFDASDLSRWYGSGTLTSSPWSGSGTTGSFGSLGAPPAVGGQTPYQFTDIYAPTTGTPPSPDYRPKVLKGKVPPAGYDYSDVTLDSKGKATADIPQRGTAASSDFKETYTSTAAKLAFGLGERAKQEAAAGRAENRERGNTILAGYDQLLANNRRLMDEYQPTFDASQAASLNDLQSGFGTAQGLLGDRYNRNMGYVNQYGDSMRSDLDQAFSKQAAAAKQSALRRGLGNTTITDSLNRGVTSDYNRSRLDLEDRLLQNRLNTDQSLSADYINSILSGSAAVAGQRNRNLAAATGLRQANTGLENQGSMARLGFLSGIQNDYPTSADYGNYLLQSGVLEETKGSRK